MIIAGVDEAGRGPLAGPVVAAAVVLPDVARLEGISIRDSKQLSAKDRLIAEQAIRRAALGWAIGAASPFEIDQFNIHEATLLAMRRAVLGLSLRPDRVLVDGRFVPNIDFPAEAIVGGDRSEQTISAASILAKVFRDRYMRFLDERYPGYAFSRHNGYPTKHHLSALLDLGPCPEHRRSFAPVRRLLEKALG